MDIQRLQAVLVDDSRSGAADPVRRWAEREGGTLVRVRSRAIEFSDDPSSRMGRDSAFLLGMREALALASTMEGGLLVVDVTGLQPDQVNRLSNAMDKTAIFLERLSLEGEWPHTRVVMPPKVLDPWPEVEGYDVVGDVHGCIEELRDLLRSLGCTESEDGWQAPEGRRIVFVGDLVDRGPEPVAVLDLVAGMCRSGDALCVSGNHDWHLQGYLNGKKAPASRGMGETQVAVAALPPDQREGAKEFLNGLPHQLLLDGGRLVVAHAGCPARLQGLSSERAVRECVFGVMIGRNDDGTPERLDWAADYRGDAVVVQGHVPVAAPAEVNGTWDIDTGCAFGNALTALRWPSMDLVSVPARRDYTGGHPTALRLAAERDSASPRGRLP